MNAGRRAIADALLAAARVHDAAQADRPARFRNVEPETAELLGVLVRATRARRVLELGTSNGYSTMWLADAVEATGGVLTTVEIDPARTALARVNLDRAGLAAELVAGDAAEMLRSSADGAWDLVFLARRRGGRGHGVDRGRAGGDERARPGRRGPAPRRPRRVKPGLRGLAPPEPRVERTIGLDPSLSHTMHVCAGTMCAQGLAPRGAP